MKIKYIDKNFHQKTLDLIELANGIIDSYEAQGFSLTLRQLYYRLVAAGEIPNTQRDYKRLGNVVNDGRLAGMIDWFAIEDRTRGLSALSHWSDPAQVIGSARDSFRIDMWENQPFRPEVWVEKDALAGVMARACQPLDVPFISCRGYMSQSEMFWAASRFKRHRRGGQTPVVIHLGDHDPSGVDMTRDIADRLNNLFGVSVTVDRIALNMDQVDQYQPPPNPAKLTDSRADGYIEEFGDSSWELDALEPAILVRLIETVIERLKDQDQWEEDEQRFEDMVNVLERMERQAGETWQEHLISQDE